MNASVMGGFVGLTWSESFKSPQVQEQAATMMWIVEGWVVVGRVSVGYADRRQASDLPSHVHIVLVVEIVEFC